MIWWFFKSKTEPLSEIVPEPLPDVVDDLDDLSQGQMLTFIENLNRNRELNESLACQEEEMKKVDWIREGF